MLGIVDAGRTESRAAAGAPSRSRAASPAPAGPNGTNAIGLTGSLTVRGDEAEPPVVKLQPTGSITGRLLDMDGQPLAGVQVLPSGEKRAISELFRELQQRRPAVETDKEGRFRVDGLVPDVKISLGLTKGRTYFVGEPRIGLRQVGPGKTLDLGDVRVRASQ